MCILIVFTFVFVFELVVNSLRILRWFVKLIVSTCECVVMNLLRFCTRSRYVFIAFYTLAYSWYLDFLQFLCHSFFCILVHLWITLVPTFLWGSFPLFTYAGDHNSCFNWILLCLIFCLCWLYEAWKGSRHFCFILSTTT